jgi:hypothetical protein
MRALFAIALAALCVTTPVRAQDTLANLAGTWEIVSPNGRSGCERGQVFTPSPDGRYVDLAEHDGRDTYRVRYIVLQAQESRILMFIETEQRLTPQGDPVVWWAVFDGPDRFRWRRYDWPRTA